MTRFITISATLEELRGAQRALRETDGIPVWHQAGLAPLLPGHGGLRPRRAEALARTLVEIDESDVPTEYREDFSTVRDLLWDALDEAETEIVH